MKIIEKHDSFFFPSSLFNKMQREFNVRLTYTLEQVKEEDALIARVFSVPGR